MLDPFFLQHHKWTFYTNIYIYKFLLKPSRAKDNQVTMYIQRGDDVRHANEKSLTWYARQRPEQCVPVRFPLKRLRTVTTWSDHVCKQFV